MGFTATQNSPFGAPFPATAANNGLSVDAGTGKIVLGDDAGGVLSTLLSDREIPMGGFLIKLIDGVNVVELSPAFGVSVYDTTGFQYGTLNKGQLFAFDSIGGGPACILDNNVAQAVMLVPGGGSVLQITDGAGNIFMTIDLLSGSVVIGDISGVANGTVQNLDDATGTHNVTNTAGNAVYAINNNPGVSGSFTTVDGKTVTVEGGIITNIV